MANQKVYVVVTTDEPLVKINISVMSYQLPPAKFKLRQR